MLQTPCKEFGAFIKFKREHNDIPVEQFAFLLGTPVPFIHRLERGEVHPTDPFMTEVSQVLNIPFDELKFKIWCNPPLIHCPKETLDE